ncbi:hypothetical protein [Bacillus sp. FJAT-27231]|uniref:hypothetical protein n=1 Tax=Bacillus sp. FJAT-27231 TaxID=1679168 RepID=UPI001E36EDDF|nr:hypothetical protein [Bacillus sp. FJAT-27231]
MDSLPLEAGNVVRAYSAKLDKHVKGANVVTSIGIAGLVISIWKLTAGINGS